MYTPYMSAENPAEIIVFAKYVDQEALETHSQTPYHKTAAEQILNLVEERSTDILDGEITLFKELV